MSEVTVIGLGAMGFALAKALLDRGHLVTVWNRTTTKAASLVESGASVADTPASAIAASDVTVVCVDNYKITLDILSSNGCDRSIKGKTLIQLSTGIPVEAREAERSLRSMGAKYLDGAILGYPEHIGTSEAMIFVSGEEDAFLRCEHLLRALAGGTTFVGSAIGQASALDSGLLCAAIGAYLGAIHGARICEIEGLSVTGFGKMRAELTPMLGGEIKHINERIASNSFDGSQATVQTYAAAARRLLQHAKGSNINTSFPSYAASILEVAELEGLGQKDLAALITVIRKEGVLNKAAESDT